MTPVPEVVLGVGGGIAAYKSADLVRRLAGLGAAVTVLPTANALRFVGAATFEALSGRPVLTDVFTDVPSVAHVRTGQHADLVVIAPATADLLAKAAAGIADDMLTSTLLVTRAPVLMAPAMHTEMWTHPATVANVATLRARGVVVLDPAVGRLTGPDSGPGRLPEPDQIAALAELLWHRPDALPRNLAGVRVLISAGGTREELDPVRFLTNRSSGKQGFALAQVAVARGADVTVVAANVALPTPPGVTVIPVGDARELHAVMTERSAAADVVVMAAAVADFRPAERQTAKIKKVSAAAGAAGDPAGSAGAAGGPAGSAGVTGAFAGSAGAAGGPAGQAGSTAETPAPILLELVPNPDILVDLVAQRRPGQLIVGFAAETGDADTDYLTFGRQKLARKGCDLLVVNRVGGGQAFEVDDNAVVILAPGQDHPVADVPSGPKTAIAAAIWDAIGLRLDGATRPASGPATRPIL